ncbi:hypothetical protein PHAVU_004G015200 [Phaseolus vulgaris]|uniref:F-box domain-containing protein n=1 Tax=Phaseolus vulgaris TaxID=3885 RepID=V7C2D4_PHAVU|nr:hypothetical protein PHAVU_004G015200g [Phaseolus vulgaris]ESW23061.1 hypothetical protein PHAVU_004G015200g [Phaseolus vulgaris]
MADIMSSFPDSILCYILSFLPTKDVVATSVLSKRWKLLWLSVTSMDFDHHDRMDFDKDACSRFLVPVYSFLLWRDMDQPLHRLRLRCCSFYNHYRVQTWIKAAMRRSGKLKHLDLNLDLFLAVPSVVFSCKTLVVLKLSHLMLSNISFVHLPLLKILHLNSVILTKCDDLLQHFLSGSPNLEDLLVKTFGDNTAEKFHILPKLVRANIDLLVVPLEIVKNVEVLVTFWIYQYNLDFDFQNLVQFELNHMNIHKEWNKVLEVLRHCPKLQTLVLGKDNVLLEYDEETFLHSQPVPTCISLHLKTFCLDNYSGYGVEFEFARYIMQNAKYLQTMKFCINSGAYDNLLSRHDMIRGISPYKKSSDACTLCFEKLRSDYFDV